MHPGEHGPGQKRYPLIGPAQQSIGMKRRAAREGQGHPVPLRVLVVGQTPPPYGGQAMMVAALLGSRSVKVELFHVRLAYSDDMNSVGKFTFRKVFILFATIFQVWKARIRHGTPMLYYPPAGPNKVPVLRDMVFLCATRWMFKWTVFHFHAGGVSGFERELPWLLRPFYRLAYRNASMAIRTAPQNPQDGELLGSRRSTVVPNGIPDSRGTVREHQAGPNDPVVILFTGVLMPTKGVHILLEAFARVLAQGANARLELMGRWGSPEFQQECEQLVKHHGMEDRVQFLGVRSGSEKLEHFAGCDIFCFPSYFGSESFGLVLIEAMQFAKPVIATQWRGIPSVIEEGENGFMVPIKDAEAVAEKLMILIDDPAQRRRMGEAGRRIFVERFTLERFYENMEEALLLAATPN